MFHFNLRKSKKLLKFYPSHNQITEWLLDTTFKFPLFDASQATENAPLPILLKTYRNE
jgi:hypothetical protein